MSHFGVGATLLALVAGLGCPGDDRPSLDRAPADAALPADTGASGTGGAGGVTTAGGSAGTGGGGGALAGKDASVVEGASGGQAAPAGGQLVTYALDLTAVRQPLSGDVRGTAIIGHNAFVAFPIDLATTEKKVAQLDWDTANEWPSAASCAGFPDGRDYVPDAERGPNAVAHVGPEDRFKGFRSPYRAHLRRIELDMPNRVPQDALVRIAEGLCVVMRTGDGAWLWRARRFVAAQDAAAGRASATIDLDVRDVDAVAILFDTTTPLATVRYTIESAGAAPGQERGDLATASCCTVCAPDGPDLASRYCCTRELPKPEPCTESETPLSPECRSFASLYEEASTSCRRRGAWLRDLGYLDPGPSCVAPDRLSPTGARGVRFKCCRDSYFVPPPPDVQSPGGECQLTGGFSEPCASNAVMLERQVQHCFQAGLVHRVTIFKNDCAGGGAGSSHVESICCRPGVAGPPVDYCKR